MVSFGCPLVPLVRILHLLAAPSSRVPLDLPRKRLCRRHTQRRILTCTFSLNGGYCFFI